MSRATTIPLWMPIGALALVLLAVGWLRTRHAPAPALVPEPSSGSLTPRPTPESRADAPGALEQTRTTQADRVAVVSAPADDARPPVVLLHGRLRDASGAPLEGAWLTLTDGAGHSASVNQSEGSYLTGGLAPGRWKASLSGQGITPLQETLELAAQPTIVEHDFIAVVRRRVLVELRTPDGTELFQALDERKLDLRATMRLALVATRQESPGSLKPSGLNRLPGNTCGVFEPRDYNGRNPLPEGCCGTFEFRAPPPLWMHVLLGHEPLASLRIDEVPERLVIVVDPERIHAACGDVTLRAVDSQSGAPLPDAYAMYGTQQMGGSMVKEDERLVLRGIAPGAYYLRLAAKGHCMLTRELVLNAGQTLDLGDVPLPPTRPLKLHVTDGEGKPQERLLTLFALVPGDARATRGRFQDSMHQRSDAQGIVNLSSVVPGKWVVLIGSLPGSRAEEGKTTLGARPWILDADCTDCPESTIVLEPTVELVLVPQSAAAIGLRYWIDTPEGLPAFASGIYRAEPQRTSLAPGPYTLTVEDADGVELLRRPIEIGSKPLEVQLPR